jgi:hypothetical protein
VNNQETSSEKGPMRLYPGGLMMSRTIGDVGAPHAIAVPEVRGAPHAIAVPEVEGGSTRCRRYRGDRLGPGGTGGID